MTGRGRLTNVFSIMDCQDWETVKVVRRGGARNGGTATQKKPLITAGAALTRQLENEDIPKPTRSLSSESRAEIVRLRTAAGQTQVQLNTACAFPVNTIKDIECGRLCPTRAQLNVLNRVLRASLKYA